MKKQIVVIHGGDIFDTYEEYLFYLKDYKIDFEKLKRGGWKDTLGKQLGGEYDVIAPQMPNKINAKYLEWKIWFEKLTPFLEEELVFAGHSLGGLFLAKYLSETTFPKKILGTFLVAAPYNGENSEHRRAGFILQKNLEKLDAQGGTIFIYHSTDDPVVPFADCAKYRSALPRARAAVFEDRGHFGQEDFPEIIRDIQSLF